MRVLASAKCVNSKVVEDVMHCIFWDYRTNDKLEWSDTNLKSMKTVMKFVVRAIDGLNRVDHDEFCIIEAMEEVMMVMEVKLFSHGSSGQPELRQEIEGKDIETPNPEKTPLNIIDAWLLHKLEVSTLPSVISFLELMKRFNQWAFQNKTVKNVNVSVFAPLVEPYQEHGLFKKKERDGRWFHVDLESIQNKLIADNKIQQGVMNV